MNYYDCKYVLFSDFNLYSCGCLKWGWVRILSFLVPILFCSGFLVQSLKQGDWWNQSLLFRIHVGTSCLKSHWQNQCRAMLLSLGACIFVIELKQGNSFPCSTWMHQERIVNEWIWVLLDCFFFFSCLAIFEVISQILVQNPARGKLPFVFLPFGCKESNPIACRYIIFVRFLGILVTVHVTFLQWKQSLSDQ